MNKVVLAIFKRNFLGYLQNPIGYVFITLFVGLCAAAAFWPDDFFIANMATLDQLNKWFPSIMLGFVPAITMSIWAEERRQGTDELLLTMPTTDFDVVFGKYLAAVAIYSVSLAFSFVCNYAVLQGLGDPDFGLFVTNYFGYWLVGLAMLAIGMVASFLTTNITVAFVLAALFNSVPVACGQAELLLPTDWATTIGRLSIADQLRDFTQGVVSASSLSYFLLIVVAMLYLSMVLIGRRHWLGGRDGQSLGPHYFARFVALALGATGLFLIIDNQSAVGARYDMTQEKLTSLAPVTHTLLKDLDAKKPITIHAFVSPKVPSEFVPIRLDLLSRLREIKAAGGANVTLHVIDTEPLTPESDRAEKAFGITGRRINSVVRGQATQETIFLGVVLVSGLDKIVLPFIESWTPIEYELIRAITTLNGAKRKRLGLLLADKKHFQELDPESRGTGLKEPEIIVELRKQFEVVDLEPSLPVPENIDVLMAIQPSLLGPPQLDHLVEAVRRGVPTAIFQDPHPYYYPAMQQAEQRQGGGLPSMQDAALQKLWDLLGVSVPSSQLVDQVGYNPLKQFDDEGLPPEFIFVGNSAIRETDPNGSLFDEKDPISRGMHEMVFIYAGSVAKKEDAQLDFSSLVRTTKVTGFVDKSNLFPPGMQEENPRPMRFQTGIEYTLAAHVRGPAPVAKPFAAKRPRNLPAADEQGAGQDGAGEKPADAASAPKNEVAPTAVTGAAAASPSATASPTAGATAAPAASPTATPSASPTPTPTASPAGPTATPTAGPTATPTATPTASPTGTAAPAKPKAMNVLIIPDIDLMTSFLFRTRSQRQHTEGPRRPVFDNVTFLLNGLDIMADDLTYVELRKRRPSHRTLTKLDELYEENGRQLTESKKNFEDLTANSLQQLETALNDEETKLQRAPDLKEIDRDARKKIFQIDRVRRFATKQQELRTKYDKEEKELRQQLNEKIRNHQGLYKALAVFIPPIFPLIIGLAVFFSRRAGEQEGVARTRLR